MTAQRTAAPPIIALRRCHGSEARHCFRKALNVQRLSSCGFPMHACVWFYASLHLCLVQDIADSAVDFVNCDLSVPDTLGMPSSSREHTCCLPQHHLQLKGFFYDSIPNISDAHPDGRPCEEGDAMMTQKRKFHWHLVLSFLVSILSFLYNTISKINGALVFRFLRGKLVHTPGQEESWCTHQASLKGLYGEKLVHAPTMGPCLCK